MVNFYSALVAFAAVARAHAGADCPNPIKEKAASVLNAFKTGITNLKSKAYGLKNNPEIEQVELGEAKIISGNALVKLDCYNGKISTAWIPGPWVVATFTVTIRWRKDKKLTTCTSKSLKVGFEMDLLNGNSNMFATEDSGQGTYFTGPCESYDEILTTVVQKAIVANSAKQIRVLFN